MKLLFGAMLAIVGVASGMMWRNARLAEIDTALFHRINGFAGGPLIDGMVRGLRFLGTTWGLVVVAGILFVWDPPGAILLLALAILSSGLERGLKRWVGRRRPYTDLVGVTVRQDPAPTDPSFPSGDASRVCYLAAALAFGLGWPPLLRTAALLVATVVSLGRIRVGVHYPSDVWAGCWLGVGMGVVWGAVLPAFRAWWG